MSSEFNEASGSDPPILCNDATLPKDIRLADICQEVDFHPSKDILAAGAMNGAVRIYSYTIDKDRRNQKLLSFLYHKQPCRCVRFSPRGDFLFTASTDKKIFVIDLNQGSLTRRMIDRESDAIYSLLSIDNYLLASGDDSGMVIIWDFRRETPLMKTKCCGDYISKFAMSSDRRTLLASCGDGSLSIFNIRSRKLEASSELLNRDMMSVAISDNGTKVVTSLNDGVLRLFNWGEWSNPVDKFACHNGSIDDILAVDSNFLLAGCEDGNIRLVHINPHKVLGMLGNSNSLPVYNLSVSHDKKYVASCAYEECVKFHKLPSLSELQTEEERNHKQIFNMPPRNAFFSGLAEL